MIRDDFLLRQLSDFARRVAQAMAGRAREDDTAIEAEVAGIVGLDLDLAAELPKDTLLGLLTTADGVDAPRALALGLGLAVRAVQASGARRARLAATASALVGVALAARPDLASDEAAAVLATLAAPEPS